MTSNINIVLNKSELKILILKHLTTTLILCQFKITFLNTINIIHMYVHCTLRFFHLIILAMQYRNWQLKINNWAFLWLFNIFSTYIFLFIEPLKGNNISRNKIKRTMNRTFEIELLKCYVHLYNLSTFDKANTANTISAIWLQVFFINSNFKHNGLKCVSNNVFLNTSY